LSWVLRTRTRRSCLDRDCRGRAWRDAGAAAGACVLVDGGNRGATLAGGEANGAHSAEIAADPAFDTVPRQAGIADERLAGPGWQTFAADQRQRLAGGGAFAAEGAFALAEINSGESAVARHQNSLWARRQAIAAAGAAVDECRFGRGPRRPHFGPGAGSTAKEAAAAGIDHPGGPTFPASSCRCRCAASGRVPNRVRPAAARLPSKRCPSCCRRLPWRRRRPGKASAGVAGRSSGRVR